MNALETLRLLLRNYTEQDKPDLMALFTDCEVMRHVGDGPLTPEQAEALWLKLIGDFYPQGIRTIYAVFAKDDGRYVGHASIRPRPQQTADWEIGYILRRNEWGQGLAAEIAARLVEFGFETLKLGEIFATIDDDNLGSIRVAEKVKMRFLRYEFDEQGRFSVYSISRKSHESNK